MDITALGQELTLQFCDSKRRIFPLSSAAGTHEDSTNKHASGVAVLSGRFQPIVQSDLRDVALFAQVYQ